MSIKTTFGNFNIECFQIKAAVSDRFSIKISVAAYCGSSMTGGEGIANCKMDSWFKDGSNSYLLCKSTEIHARRWKRPNTKLECRMNLTFIRYEVALYLLGV